MAIFKQVNNSGSSTSKFKTSNLKKYLEQEEKLEMKTTINCSSNWDKDFERNRMIFDKKDGRIHSHYVLSFSNDDDIKNSECHKFAEKFIERVEKFKDCQVAIITHKDETHAHAHIIVNQVKLDGKKLSVNRSEMLEIKKTMKELTREINKYREINKNRKLLIDTKIEKNSFDERKEIRLEKENNLENLNQKVKYILDISYSKKEFLEELKNKNIEFKETYQQIKVRNYGDRRWIQERDLKNIDNRLTKLELNNYFEIKENKMEIERNNDFKEVIKYELERSESKKEFIQNLEEREINFSLDDDNEIYFNSYRFDTKEFFNELELDFNSFNEYFLEKERELELEIRF